jgi:cytochrome c556
MRRLFIAVATLLVASLAIPLAQQPPPQPPQQPQPPAGQAPQGGRGGRGGAAPATPPKPLVPVAASTVVNNPDQFVGEFVSLTAPVEATLTKSAFAVDQDKTKTDKEILIIAPTLQNAPTANAYVTVLGELVKFDPAEIPKKTKNYTLDLTPEQIAKYTGKPAIVATAVVVNATGVDIAKVIPPPMTPEELEFQKIMRQVGPANTALRAAIDKMDATAVKDQAAVLAGAFTKTEAFFKTKNKPDATGFATEARKHTDTITAAVAAGNWDSVKAAAAPLGQQCAACHGAYRERLDDGSFRIKLGSGAK